MANFTTVLWDLDGTIVDSSPGIYESFRATFAELQIECPSDEQLRSFMGPPLPITFGQLLGFDEELTQRAIHTYRKHYLPAGALNASLFPGVVELIQTCRDAHLAVALATSKGESGTRIVGEKYDFLRHFHFLGTASADDKRNTKSDVIAYALDGLRDQGLDTSNVLLVGDRIHDVEGAREQGIQVALVEWGFGTADEWAQADFIAADTDALAAYIGIA
jgi:phosphoglycolate phosphatase